MIRKYQLIPFLFMAVTTATCHSRDTGNEYDYTNPDTVQTTSSVTGPADLQKIKWPTSFGIGRKASSSEIGDWDIDVRPDGKGLPDGEGDVTSGRMIYAVKCVSCHGVNGSGGAYARLVGVMGDTVKAKTIGNYWPYSTTLFDYMRRAMPYNTPGSLKDDEVYSLTAYLLFMNKIIDSTTEMNRHTLPKVIMPAKQYYVNDDRRGGAEVR